MSTLIIYKDSILDQKFLDMWEDSKGPKLDWSSFIKTLDVNIISVCFVYETTTIEFTNEAHKSWFILRWS